MRPLLLTLCFALVSFTAAQTISVPKAIRANYRAIDAAWRAGDVEAFTAFNDPSFQYVAPDGKTSNLQQLKNDISAMLKGSTKQTIRLKLTSYRQASGMAEVGFNAVFSTKVGKKVTRTQEIGTDTWRKMVGGWRLVKTVDTSFGPAK